MDIIFIVVLSYLLFKICKKKGIYARFWIYRFVTLSIAFELCIGLIFLSIYGISFMKDMERMTVVGLINIFIIVALFFLVRRNILQIQDDNNNDTPDETPPEKDLSYFR